MEVAYGSAGRADVRSFTAWFTDEAVAGWRAAPRTTPGGQPWHSPLAILTALTLRAVFRLALRQTEGLIGFILGLLGLPLAVPDHSTLSRRAETLEVLRPQPRRDGEPMHLLVDSTGLRLCGAGEWLLEKHGTKTRRSWRKLHIGIDADTGQIVAEGSPREVVTEEVVRTVFGLDSRVIDDPVSHTPLVVPVGRHQPRSPSPSTPASHPSQEIR